MKCSQMGAPVPAASDTVPSQEPAQQQFQICKDPNLHNWQLANFKSVRKQCAPRVWRENHSPVERAVIPCLTDHPEHKVFLKHVSSAMSVVPVEPSPVRQADRQTDSRTDTDTVRERKRESHTKRGRGRAIESVERDLGPL
jgi:hypothetical protein